VKKLLGLATLILTIGLTGCGGDQDPSSQASESTSFLDAPKAVVTGRLLQGDAAGKNLTPVPGSITLTGSQGATVSTEVGTTGRFEVQVLPGEYQITGAAPQPDGGVAGCNAKEPKTVLSLDTANVVEVICLVSDGAR